MAAEPIPETSDVLSRELEIQVRQYAERVRQAAARYGLSGQDVDEVFQEVRIRMWRTLSKDGNIPSLPASYVYRIALSSAVDLIRRRRARRAEAAADDDPAEPVLVSRSPQPDALLEEKSLGEAVHREIQQLPEDRALVLRMHLEGFSRDEIAALLHWSEPRVRHLIYRGLAQLRDRLRARGIGPELIE